MKKTRAIIAAVIFALLLMTGALAAEESGDSAYILYPSEAESTVAAGRDFYVVAKCGGEAVGATVLLTDGDGVAVREISSGYDDFFTDFEGLTAFNTDYGGYLMPDLLYDPADPDSLTYAHRKCYVKNGFAVALVTGGNWEGIAAHLDENGEELKPLAAGKYTLTGSFELADGETVVCEREMTLGATGDKVISRFSPDYHLENVKKTAGELGYRLYIDPLPGYWSPSSIFGDGSDYFAELAGSWKFADAYEYSEGNVYFYLYNVSEGSATNSVELAAMRLAGNMDERLSVFCYDYGEPGVAYTDFSGVERELSCGFAEMDDALELNRMQLEKGVAPEDNAYSVKARPLMSVDTEQADGYACAIGDTLTFFGTAAPLQDDIIKTVQYVFTKGGTELLRESRPLGLVRELDADWFGTSMYEFAHSFAVPDGWEGEILVSVRAMNEDGEPVEGGEESFTLAVGSEGAAFRDVSSREDGAVYLLAAKGIVLGTGGRYYEPERAVTAAELLTMLGRAAGVAPSGEWYEAYVDWADGKGADVDDIFGAVARDSELLAVFGLSDKVPDGDGAITRAEAAGLVAAFAA
ncbi:MAG: hypothetical protein GX847_07595 [Clostridiales bacterium]|nr:hypothetical protein [Clostridiales bacterium]